MLPSELRRSFVHALQATGARVTLTATGATAPSPGTRLMLATTNGKGLGELLQSANLRGLFEHELGSAYPGASRGFIGAAFAARTYGENAVAVVGGDQEGLNAAARRLISILDGSTAFAIGCRASRVSTQHAGCWRSNQDRRHPEIERRDRHSPVGRQSLGGQVGGVGHGLPRQSRARG